MMGLFNINRLGSWNKKDLLVSKTVIKIELNSSFSFVGNVNMEFAPDKDKYIAEINVVAFVAVMLVLLIEVMIILHPNVCESSDSGIFLPKTLNAIEDEKINKDSAIILWIPDNGVYYLGKDPITRELIAANIVELLKGRKISDRNVYIKMGSPVLYGTLIDVMSELRSKGINDIGLVTNNKIKK